MAMVVWGVDIFLYTVTAKIGRILSAVYLLLEVVIGSGIYGYLTLKFRWLDQNLGLDAQRWRRWLHLK